MSTFRSPRPLALAVAAGILAGAPAAAHAADRWAEAAGGAVAILPTPVDAKGITGGSLFCAEQRWSFLLRTEPQAIASGWNATATLTVGESSIEAPAVEAGGAVDIAIPTDFLGPLHAGNRLVVTADALSASFSLRGSGATIDAIRPRCSQIDMSAYSQLSLSPTGPDLDVAKKLMADEAELFRAWTGKQPDHATAALDLAAGNRLLFVSLCGSTGYYGQSGCTLSGFARLGAAGEWRAVYGSDGVHLYTDPANDNGGWPNLVTLPLSDATVADHWVWDGAEYQIREALIADDEAASVPEEGDGDGD